MRTVAQSILSVSRIDLTSIFMERKLIYETIREEILEQKKCQFQIFTASVTVTSAILAFASASKLGGIVYVAPMLLNFLAMWMLIDKAISVQRKVGYLQLIEKNPAKEIWRWETDLDAFRADAVTGEGAKETRKHSYITMVALMLLFLNVFCAALYFFGPDSSSPKTVAQGRAFGWMDAFCILLLLAGFWVGWSRRDSLIRGNNSTTAIAKKWERVFYR
jgi:hypothetical protein